MNKPLYIIKLGGSIITDKSKGKGAFRNDVVKRLVAEIAEAKKKKDFDLILIHGAGSYPHYLTTKYKFIEGFKGPKTAWGYSHVKNELFKLNNKVWGQCLKAGLNVCTVEPCAVVFTKETEINRFDTGLIDGLLRMGIAPLLMGDDSIDETRGISILSGDKTMAYLAKKYNADKVIFVSDVDGVFDKNPKAHKDAKLISEINSENFKKIIDSMEVFNKNDASGEMKGKLMAVKKLLSGVDVVIANGLKSGTIKSVLSGGRLGSRIRI